MSPGLLPPFCSAPGAIKFLSRADAPAILDLYNRCSDYFLLQDGEPAAASDADELFDDVPPSKQPEDQHVLGYCSERRLDAVAALLTDHPDPGDWYVGLLLLDPHQRGRGLGRELYADIERWSADRGAKRMMLAVLKENAQAQRFWRSLGFEHVRTVQPATFKRKSHIRYELARRL
jgi:ribosomal protein S18 acetylase RimI-like enzyme